MGLLEILRLRKKQNKARVERKCNCDHAGTSPATQSTNKKVVNKKRFTIEQFTKDMTDWFNRRNNKWLTKVQIQTMVGSPVKGIANSSFYRFVRQPEFEVNFEKRPIKYRLSLATKPAVKYEYGVSLSVILQQLKGVKKPITLHRNDCFWGKRYNHSEWLSAPTLDELHTKVKKLFKAKGKGKVAKYNRVWSTKGLCRACTQTAQKEKVTR